MKHVRVIVLVSVLLPVLSAIGQTWTWTWVRKVGNAGFNHSLTVNPKNSDILYGSPGNATIVISRDRGKTWQTFSSVPGGSQVKMIRLNARDTSIILVAQEAGPPDRIMKSTDNGVNWTQVLSGNFWYWGHPMAYEPAVNPDLVYAMGSNIIYRSTDFGSTWTQVGPANPFGSSNQGWEHAIIRPDSGNILYVADNATGIWKSTDAGNSWRRVFVASGEVPAIALNPGNPAIAYATKFGGGGGFVKTTNYGETWLPISQFNGINTWGVDICPDYPNYVIMGTWGHAFSSNGGIYISRDDGATWDRTYQGLSSTSNHQCFVLDTMTVLVLQGDGIWKLIMPGEVTGVCFNDLNANSVQDAGEPMLQNWKVFLGGSRVDSTLTSSSGAYRFSMLSAGVYNVTAHVLPGWMLTFPPGGVYSSLSVSDGERYTNRNFGLTQGVITILTPNGGEVWPVDSLRAIEWSSAGFSENVTIELSRDGGVTYGETLFSSTPNDGVELWTVTGPPTNEARVRIRRVSVPGVADVSDANFVIRPAISSVSVIVNGGWNIISNPMVTSGDSVHQLYPLSLYPYAFSYVPGAGYVQEYLMQNGRGYWAKFASTHTNVIYGTVLSVDSIDVQPGWNMIGTISCAVDTSTIITLPPGIRSSNWFGYEAGYYPATEIVPGKAYWVKVTQSGKVVLRCPMAQRVPDRVNKAAR